MFRTRFLKRTFLLSLIIIIIIIIIIIVGQVTQVARRLATGWMAQVRSRGSEGVEIFLHSFVSRRPGFHSAYYKMSTGGFPRG